MARRVKSKTSAGAMFLRVLVVIIISAIAAVLSFTASKAFFASKLKSDKKAKIAAQLKAESKEHVDVTLQRVDSQLVIRVYHNKNKQMIFVPIRKDTLLTLDSDGKDLVGSSKATVEALIAKTTDMKVIKKQVEKTLSISISNYESLSTKKFAKAVDNAGDVSIELDSAVSYKDKNDMTVHISAGNNTLNGNQVLGLVTDSSGFNSESDHITLVGELAVKVAVAAKSQSSADFKSYAKEFFNLANCNYEYKDISEYIKRMHDIDDKDFTYQILEGTEGEGEFTLDKSAATTVFDELLSETGTTATSTTEEATTKSTTAKKKSSTTSSSKGIGIEIQNSTKISGLAGNWKDKLSGDGYTVDSILTNSQGVLTHTKIIVAKDGMGEDLKSYFKNPTITVGSVSSGADICIILGTEDEI